MIEKLTLHPGEFGPGDVRPLRDAGVDDEGIEQVALICSLFNTIVRLADSLEFDVPTAEEFATWAPRMLNGGYA